VGTLCELHVYGNFSAGRHALVSSRRNKTGLAAIRKAKIRSLTCRLYSVHPRIVCHDRMCASLQAIFSGAWCCSSHDNRCFMGILTHVMNSLLRCENGAPRIVKIEISIHSTRTRRAKFSRIFLSPLLKSRMNMQTRDTIRLSVCFAGLFHVLDFAYYEKIANCVRKFNAMITGICVGNQSIFTDCNKILIIQHKYFSTQLIR
jgi:hypothetical protein